MKTLHCSEDIEKKREKNITKAKKYDYKKEKAQNYKSKNNKTVDKEC